MVIIMSNGMVQTVTEKGERIVDFKLLENQLLTDIMPYIEKNSVSEGRRRCVRWQVFPWDPYRQALSDLSIRSTLVHLEYSADL